jgi:hypothetical protein
MALWADVASRIASPYDFNPLNVNPLKEVLEELVDFERVRACKGISSSSSAPPMSRPAASASSQRS